MFYRYSFFHHTHRSGKPLNMTQSQKEKLKTVLNELYESGVETSDMIGCISEGLVDSEKIGLAEDILEGVNETDKEYFSAELMNRYCNEGNGLQLIINNIGESDIINAAMGVDYIRLAKAVAKDVDLVREINDRCNESVRIPYKMLTMDKQDKLRDFLAVLFPYYNEQQALELNFI